MKNAFIAATIFAATTVLATGGHFHPKKVANCESKTCTEAQIKEAVPAGIKELANWKQLDAKWESAKIESVAKKEFKKGKKTINAWVVALLDEKQTDTANNKVYVYFTEDGSVFRTNKTGELK